MTDIRYRMLLRTLFGAAIHSRLTPADLKTLSYELRRGRLADELAFMIDRALDQIGGSERGVVSDEQMAEAERLMRRNRTGKTVLASILSSLGTPTSATKDSARVMLNRFFAEASATRVDKLLELLASQQKYDGFLAGIDGKRN